MKIEYEDLYKFISSLGITIIISPFIIAWFFLKEPFSWMFEKVNVLNISENAKKFTIKREELLIFIVSNIRIYFIISILIGIIMILVGILLWVKRQQELDRNQALVNEKLEKELKDMSPKEITENQVNSIDEIVEKEDSIEITEDEKCTIESELNFLYDRNLSKNLSEYVLIEDRIYKLFYETYHSEYVILKNKKISKFEYDLILQNKEQTKNDIIVEIKYMKSSFSKSRLIELKEKMEAYKTIYFNYLGINASALIIIIVEDGQITRNMKVRYMNEVNLQEENNQLLIFFDTELYNLDSKKLLKMIKK